MKRFIVLALLVMVIAVPASADNDGPCTNSEEPVNSDYAAHHIVPPDVGVDGHIAGNHEGFSTCVDEGEAGGDGQGEHAPEGVVIISRAAHNMHLDTKAPGNIRGPLSYVNSMKRILVSSNYLAGWYFNTD